MNQDFFIALTLATHRVLELFPAEQHVKLRLSESANRALADLILITQKNPVTDEQRRLVVPRCLRELEYLQDLLTESQNENWIRPENFLVLRKQYRKLARELEDLDLVLQETKNGREADRQEPKREKTESVRVNGSLSQRQTKILEILRTRQKAQVRELQRVLPEVTKRTLRRDLDDLLKSGLVERQGEWNSVVYRVRVWAVEKQGKR
jgi:DNA-binding transcriptional ArsR family regulator